ncbi:hypothetical protein CPB83DRAFT_879583 [Crepidotus variabilis]|uniref:NAD(P)-binding protein n=1 Tax=Crepidotus variabilis TaxID=179855 RepID=A0A9P6EQS6_9AGAR|nr:hypothetical protein CPB83DRAFT_879583 [Crepidotus variabilis]
MSSNLVAFIIGAGSNIGDAVAAKLREQDYKVALGSRNPKVDGKAKGHYFPVKVDAQSKESVLAAFESVSKELGPVNVVVYNVGGQYPPPNPKDFLSIPLDDYFKQSAVGLNAYTAAQAALPGFRDPVHKNHPKAFIVTGNILVYNWVSSALHWHTLGIQKTLEARLIATSAGAYEEEGIKFYYAFLVGRDGGIPDYDEEFLKSGPIHADVYWKLIDGEKKHWEQRFDLDGKKFPHEERL